MLYIPWIITGLTGGIALRTIYKNHKTYRLQVKIEEAKVIFGHAQPADFIDERRWRLLAQTACLAALLTQVPTFAWCTYQLFLR